MKALLIDEGVDRASLTAARALVDGGWQVGCAAPVRSLACRVRGVTEWHQLPDVAADAAAFVDRVAAVMRAGAYDVVIPAWEKAILALSADRERLLGVLPFASRDILLRSFDKLVVTELAREIGIATPHTAIATPETLAEWRGPLVLKPSTHFCTAERFATAAAASARVQGMTAAGIIPLAQTPVAGELMAFAAVADRQGRLVSVSQQRAEHVWPRDVGITARGSTVPIDPVLREKIAELVLRLGWFGLCQLQFLVDQEAARLIDFNGRWYGSMALALRAGANQPLTWARLALDLPVRPSEAKAGVQYQWLTRDLRASLSSSRSLLELGRAAALAPRAAHSLWSPDQPPCSPLGFSTSRQ